jgi:hypothetical protein
VTGLRCIFVHPTGLHLPVVLVARGEPADVVQRQQMERHRHRLGLALRSAPAAPVHLSALGTSAEGEVGEYRQESDFWFGALPGSREVVLTESWPEIGLPATAVTIQLPDLAAVARTSIPLR